MRWNLLRSQAPKAVPRIPAGKRIYAIGDVHGRADLLTALLTRIDEDLRVRPIDESVQIFLGDYIDRGPHSRQVIDMLIERRKRHSMVFLKGNHEECALRFLTNPAVYPDWKRIGGVNTLISYGVKPSRGDHPRLYQELAKGLGGSLPENHRSFLRGLALSFSCGDFFFTHAGVRPGVSLQMQHQSDLLWIRDDFLLHEDDFGKVVVHGHTPSREPEVRPNRINIDTGAYATGRLTCLVLEDDRMEFLGT